MKESSLSVTVEDWESIYSLIQMKLSVILKEKEKMKGAEICAI